jgi:hypothetical protein
LKDCYKRNDLQTRELELENERLRRIIVRQVFQDVVQGELLKNTCQVKDKLAKIEKYQKKQLLRICYSGRCFRGAVSTTNHPE